MYLTREYAPLPKRLEGFLGYSRAVPALAANIRANLRTPLPKAFIERGAAGFGGYATFFRTEMPAVFAQLTDEKLKGDLIAANTAAATAMEELTAWLRIAARHRHRRFRARVAPEFLEMLRQTETGRHPARRAGARGSQGPRTQSRGAQGSVRRLCTEGESRRLRREDARQQTLGRQCRRRACATRGAASVRARQEDRHHPEPGAGAGGGVAAVQPRQLRVHQHSRSLREPGGEGHVLRRAAGCQVERRGAQCLSSGQGLSAVRICARSVAGSLPAVAVS